MSMGNQVIIVEIDEDKHNGYDNSCENKRVMLLSKDVGHRPIVLIRFNPDSYKKNNTKIPSCWGENGKGICVVKNTDDWNERLKSLKETVEYWINNETKKTIENIRLYYDVLR